MASARQIHVGGVPVGGGAPVAVQTMTKTETANLQATMDQIRRVAEAGADIVRVAVPREQDVAALRTIVTESPIPVIADIHFNHTLAIKALDAGAHCVRINPGNIGGPEKTGEVVARARELGTPLRIGVNSGSLPKHLRDLEFSNPVEALVTAAVEYVELMERLDFADFKVSMKSTSVPNTIASNRLLSDRIPYPLHLGVTEAGTKWSGSLKSAVGLGTLLADGIGDTIRISLSTFHAEEEVKVAWEILKALKLRERGPVLIACPTCGRLQFDMDSVVAEVERRLEAYDDAIEVSVLGCAVNGIGEARHADFGITGAKDMGMIYSKGEPLKKVATEQLVDELFKEIDRYYAAGQDGRARRGAGRGRARVARRRGGRDGDDAGAPGRAGGRRGGRGRAGRSDPGSARRGGLAGRGAAVQPGVGPSGSVPPLAASRSGVAAGRGAGGRRRRGGGGIVAAGWRRRCGDHATRTRRHAGRSRHAPTGPPPSANTSRPAALAAAVRSRRRPRRPARGASTGRAQDGSAALPHGHPPSRHRDMPRDRDQRRPPPSRPRTARPPSPATRASPRARRRSPRPRRPGRCTRRTRP